MGLQVKRTGSTDYGFYVKALICGEPGSGKTLTASTWPNPLYANAEGGLMSVAALNLPTVDITDSGVMLELKNALMQPPAVREKMLGTPVDTVIIDTIDEVARLLVKERLEQTNKDTMAIADWGWLGESLRSMIRAYRNLPLNVIFNCHLKSVEDADSGSQYFKPAIQGAMGDEIAGYVDIAGVLTARPITEVIEGKTHRRIVRLLQTFPDVKRPWIKDRSGKLPMEFIINFDDDYKRLHELIYGDIVDHQPEVQETIVQPSQVAPVVVEEPVVAEVEVEAPAPAPEPKKRASRAKKEAAPVPVAETPPAAAPEPEPAPTPEAEPEVATPEAEPVEAPVAATEEAPEDIPVAEEVAAAPAPAPAPEPEPEVAVPEPETTEASAHPVCEECGNPVENMDQAELSKIRFRQVLCRADFAARRKR